MWILFILAISHGYREESVSVTTQEFKSQQSCQLAVEIIKNRNSRIKDIFCIPK